MINLAGDLDCERHIVRELAEAGIGLVFHTRRSKAEVPSCITGELNSGAFQFRRAWYYWVVEGNVHLTLARQMYAAEERRDVRVAGHCGSPDPEEWASPSEKQLRAMCAEEGYSYDLLKDVRHITHYHIDTQEGLNFFVRCIKTGKVEQP